MKPVNLEPQNYVLRPRPLKSSKCFIISLLKNFEFIVCHNYFSFEIKIIAQVFSFAFVTQSIFYTDSESNQNLVTFTEEILHTKLHFLNSDFQSSK